MEKDIISQYKGVSVCDNKSVWGMLGVCGCMSAGSAMRESPRGARLGYSPNNEYIHGTKGASTLTELDLMGPEDNNDKPSIEACLLHNHSLIANSITDRVAQHLLHGHIMAVHKSCTHTYTYERKYRKNTFHILA